MRRLIRLTPTLLDVALVYFIVLVIGTNYPDLDQLAVGPKSLDRALFWILVFVGVTVFYNAVADILLDGRSIGKWALGFVPVGLDGRATTKGQHLQRFGFKLIGLCLFRGSRDDGIPLHDKKAGLAFVSRLTLLQPAAASGWTLRIMNGSLAGKIVPLDRYPGFRATGTIKVGRGRDWADVTLEDHGVSRNHAQIQTDGRGLTVVDLESRNGTWVNGQRLPPNRPVPIRSRTQILFGPITAVLEPR